VLKHLDETRVDEGLVEHLAGICHRFGVLKNIHNQQSSKVDKLKTTEVLVIETNRAWNEHVKNAEAQQREPLELNVVDSYQAGEICSTRNLSGGESFIVSLSLALGLSHMASKNVRVDSLFLDEGFGTLDEEALETALKTLAGLQQDGKLIGVISHVPALKERISTQIQVNPQTGGRSMISGPGCGE